ncbi:hypothetical protein JZO72_07100 [Vagococcus fluvialis]|uniref:hypothetical protein n=1 Tax=Vagococcus fluvialis TaxID=2738 RepID=UPI001A8DDB61|nr:hypothetical protein [Vagococcus fluvialis]MBO0479393.1 hypothetical protein [Vagococcus fluvialis]MBO0483787.1 hypothetical protein [Vagococcus fluvialis]
MTNKENPTIPKFSLKSAGLLFLAGIIGGIVVPYFFYEMNWDTRIGVLLFLPILISSTIAYAQCFIETKDRIGRRFYRTLIISFIVLETVTYFWLFKGFIF